MATVRAFSAYSLADLGNPPLTGPDPFSIPADASFTLLLDDAGSTLDDNPAGQTLYAIDNSTGLPVAGSDGVGYFIDSSFNFDFTGGSYTAYVIEDTNGNQYVVFPANLPPLSNIGTNNAIVESLDTSATGIDYNLLDSRDETLASGASSLDLSGADNLFGGDGNDSIVAEGGGDVVQGGGGNDSIDAGAGSDAAFGGAGRDTIDGGADADNLFGDGGDDSLQGGTGADQIFGGGGQDTIDGGADNDTIVGDFVGASDVASTRLSFNWSELADPSGDGTTVDDGDNLNAGVSQDTGGIQVDVSFTNDGDASVGTGDAFDFNSGDVVFGTTRTQFVNGIDGGSETVNGASALFLGGAGGSGGAGVNNATSTTRIDFSSTNPALEDEVTNVQFRINDIDTAGWRDVVRIKAFDAEGNRIAVTITESGTNLYSLSDATDTDGAGGSDFVGLDTVTADPTATNTFIDQANGSVLITVPGPVQRIEIDYGNFDTDFQRIDVTDIFFDTIPATYADSISGGAGDDLIQGQEGADIIDGGTGNDTLYGGADEDTFVLTDTFGTDTIFGGDTGTGGGTDQDTIDASGLTVDGVSIVFTAEEDGTINRTSGGGTPGTFDDIEDFILSDQDDRFSAAVTTTARTVDGMGGDDTIEGGTGDDSLAGGDGEDTISYLNASGPVTVDLTTGTATGAAGNDSLSGFENITGSDFNDTLTGDDAANVIGASEGTDTISAGGGNDIVEVDGADSADGGAGDDLLLFSFGTDVDVTFDSSTLQGTDLEGGTYGGFETISADNLDASDPEGDGTDDAVDDDEITISNILTPSEVPLDQFDATAAGTFTPIGGGTPVAFGPGEAVSLQDLFTSGPGGGPRNGDYSITSGDRDGTISGNLSITGFETVNFQMVCFTRGTMIATPEGERAIEDLEVGDLVLTKDNGAQPLRWVGSRTVKAEGRMAPVVFKRWQLRQRPRSGCLAAAPDAARALARRADVRRGGGPDPCQASGERRHDLCAHGRRGGVLPHPVRPPRDRHRQRRRVRELPPRRGGPRRARGGGPGRGPDDLPRAARGRQQLRQERPRRAQGLGGPRPQGLSRLRAPHPRPAHPRRRILWRRIFLRREAYRCARAPTFTGERSASH